jgi:hypothetical protein
MKKKSNDTPSGAVLDAREGEWFKNRFEALQWLKSRGKISMGKFYQDCKAGFVTIYPDKTVSKFSVAMYAEKHFAGFTRQGPAHSSAGSTTQKGIQPMSEKTGINAAVKVEIESGGVTAWGDQDSSGVFTIHVRAMIDFSGSDLQEIIERLAGLNHEQVEAVTASAVTSSLVELLGPGIADGGVYVQG